MYQKYLFQNYAMATAYRPYNDNIPDFLDRPRKVVLHCMDWMRKSSKFKHDDIQTENSDGRFQFTSASGKVQKVDFGKETGVPSCTCVDWMRFHIPYKHFFAIFSNELSHPHTSQVHCYPVTKKHCWVHLQKPMTQSMEV